MLEHSLTLKRLLTHYIMTYLLRRCFFFYRIRGTANARLNNHLTNINQYIIADDQSYGMLLIAYGVPQRSVLCPVLRRLLCINDIMQNIPGDSGRIGVRTTCHTRLLICADALCSLIRNSLGTSIDVG